MLGYNETKTNKFAYLNCLARQLVITPMQALYFDNSTYFLFCLLRATLNDYYAINLTLKLLAKLVVTFFYLQKCITVSLTVGYGKLGFVVTINRHSCGSCW